MPCLPSGHRALHSLDGDTLHVLGTAGVDVALRVLNSLEGWVGPVLLRGTAAVTAEGHGGHRLPFACHPQSSPPCLSHPSPRPSTSKTGTTSVWELRRMDRRRGFVPCQVRTSTTQPWHTCGARAGRHQGPRWGQRGRNWQAGAKKHQPGRSFLMPPGRSPLSPLGKGMSAPSQSQTELGRGCELLAAIQTEEGKRTQRFPPVPGSPLAQPVPGRRDVPSQRDSARSLANHSTGGCKGQWGAARTQA